MAKTHRLLLSIFLFLWINEYTKCSANLRPVFHDDDCMEPIALGMESGGIPDSSIWASTSGKKRSPEMARLGHASGAWSASTPNGEQFLAINLGQRYIITAVGTQGRQGTEEYVSEFMLETSDDNNTWRMYTNELGIDEVFIANSNGHDVKKNTLAFPIRAQYIKFRPQRWSSSMSLRVEIYGCSFESDVGFFDEKTYITYDLTNLPIPIHTEQDLLRIHFRTSKPDGVLFYTNGDQGDYLAIELKRGYLYLHIDLGSTQMSRGASTLVGGSMLDDHQWHDVILQRKKKKITLIVDRLETIEDANGDFFRLDIDSKLFVGGLPTFTKPGITVRHNFYGCIENVVFNNLRLIRDAKQQLPRYSIHGTPAYSCQLASVVPVTFSTGTSHIEINGESSGVGSGFVRASFDFRTHNVGGMLFYHEMSNKDIVEVKLNSEGHIVYSISSDKIIIKDIVRNNDVESPTTSFNDGLWHSFLIAIDSSKVNCTVDRNSKVSVRVLDVKAGADYFLGSFGGKLGFIGCMRHLDIGNLPVDDGMPRGSKPVGITIGNCAIRNRCTPNPCENGGICMQDWNTFTCDCSATGYKGAVCHISEHYLSCHYFKIHSQNEISKIIKVDLDGSGPLRPFTIDCSLKSEDGVDIAQTSVGHNSENEILVNGYKEPGSYVRHVRYDTGILELEALIERATSCKQLIRYKCNNSLLLANPEDGVHETYGWWVGRTYQPMYYWGKAAPGSRKCNCGLVVNGCAGKSTTCNCDSNLPDQTDSGYLEHKDYLPVLEMHFGDTGTVTDNKFGKHKLGKLMCKGDNLFDNVITFRKVDAIIKLNTFDAKSSGDIWFQFKTTARDGVMIHCVGSLDYIKVEIFNGNTVKFQFNAGDGERVLEAKTSAGLNDDRWHTVHVERNRKQAWLKLDTQGEKVWNEPPEQGPRTLDLTSALIVGAAVGYHSGFVGCIRGLMVNGAIMDLRGMVARGVVTYGVSEGCVGKCMSNPCFNGGTCYEGYSHYTCDCSYTPFRGWMCGREVGANMLPNYMISYKFDESQGLSASDFNTATIGFSTAKKQGILMQISNKENTEYISVEINNHGGVKMAFDVGFGRDELNTKNQDIDYTNNQQHVVSIKISNRGRHIRMQVDNYEPAIFKANVGDQVDSILDKPAIMYIGRNKTMPLGKGFEGCIFRMQVQNIFPLKRAFQDPRPSYISVEPEGEIREDMCGFEEITQAPDPVESRPFDPSLVNITYPSTRDNGMALYERVVIGVVLSLFLLILIIVLYIICYHTRQKGDYETKEAKGADMADNPDMAIMYNQEGLPIPKRQEWFV
ncbi:neurexin-4 [Octopus sinensis]|uniref:Neurexin-4 n=1 Tax=Octopus sinensis TaxID=2607531 RepID=A0A6P7S5I8_9MOLL|nr:neurexin-4 [Octopus sinensis]